MELTLVLLTQLMTFNFNLKFRVVVKVNSSEKRLWSKSKKQKRPTRDYLVQNQLLKSDLFQDLVEDLTLTKL